MFDREVPHSTENQLQFLTGELTTEFLGDTSAGSICGSDGPVGGRTGTPCCVSRSGLCTIGCVA